jgi:hypothetical protein
MNSWTWSTGFPLEKQFLEFPISGILHLGPSTFEHQPAVPDFVVRPPELKNNSKKVHSLRKIHKNSPETSKF